jgi:hypothetical protein
LAGDEIGRRIGCSGVVRQFTGRATGVNENTLDIVFARHKRYVPGKNVAAEDESSV